MNGADRLCNALLANGVDVCFANPGTSEMHFVAALDRQRQMRCVLGMFEGVVTGAADGYARMADKPAATLLHLGPGLTNGLANLHNAKRARTPMINVVGNHATYHLSYDAPLTSDVEALAGPMSQWVRSVTSASDIDRDTNDAWSAAVSLPGVATLILPADMAWSDAGEQPVRACVSPRTVPVAASLINQVVKAVRSGQNVALLLGGKALREKPLRLAAGIAASAGVQVFTETANARMERGAGRAPITRIPYRIDAAVELLRDVDVLVLVGASEPAAFFAYPGKPSRPHRAECEVISLAPASADLTGVLEWLSVELGASPPSRSASVSSDLLPAGALTGDAVCRFVAKMLPEGAVVCDESITAGWTYYGLSHNAAPHDYLELTGGAIGIGIPLSTGAAIACPNRKVVCLQADGSGMYTIQGLWTQARENLDIVTIIFANRTYGTLHGEMRNVGVNQFGDNAKRMLNLDNPELDWVSMAMGMGVEAARADTSERFADLLAAALGRRGPFLIEARI